MKKADFLTVKELAAELGISAASAYRYLAPHGTIPVVRLTAATLRIRRSDLEAWLASRRTTPMEKPSTAQSIRDLPGASRYVS